MNNQTKIGLLMIGVAAVITVGHYVNAVPMALAHLVIAVIMGYSAYIHLQRGELVSTVGVSAISGAFLTLVLSSVTPISFYPLTLFLLAIGLIGGVHNVVTGIRG